MYGHINTTLQGDPIFWADASLERLDAGYEEFAIYVREDSGVPKKIRCIGFIGFQMIGFWDEIIIETANIHITHPFIGDCEHRIKLLPETGTETRFASKNLLLEISFIDGCKLWVCAKQFLCESVRQKNEVKQTYTE